MVLGAKERVDAWISNYQGKDLLRFLTCGSVDDGKSTLIGRLLYDSNLIYDDQLKALKKASEKHGTTGSGNMDLALLTDGLKAEQEQGITIDVAFRYFATEKRKFIIADCPGHEQYTRNMATGASSCNLAVILVDARAGMLPQTKRHSFIVSLLGIRHVVVAVNKMDLVSWSQARFEEIRSDYTAFASRLDLHDLHFLPISALHGDNVACRSGCMDWYEGGTLLGYLENVHIASDRNLVDLRFPVQLALRPSGDFRGYAGTVASGVVRTGHEVLVLPSRRRSRVASILGPAGPQEEAFAPQAMTLTLEDDLDCGRGDIIVHPGNVPPMVREAEAMMVWMHEEPLSVGREYLVRHVGGYTPAVVSAVRYAVDVNTLSRKPASELGLNGIGRVRLAFSRPLALDSYERNRVTGSLALVDRATNATVACAMVRAVSIDSGGSGTAAGDLALPERRALALGHRPAVLIFAQAEGPMREAEKILLAAGHGCLILDPASDGLSCMEERFSAARWALSCGQLVLASEGALALSGLGAPTLRPAGGLPLLEFLQESGIIGC